MRCLWPSPKTASITVLATVMLFTALSGVLAWCSATWPFRVISQQAPLAKLETSLRHTPAHISEFAPLSELLAVPQCGSVQPPEALLTPDPLLELQSDDRNVRVSFIVGSDGHVHSPFILESGGPGEDQIVLRAVRLWRYRPALCNGVPTDFEARVRFSIR
jgi:TonB family protein